MKKIFIKSSILFALVATSLLFFACARTPDDSKKNGSDSTNTNKPEDTPNDNETDEPITITAGSLTITTLKSKEASVLSLHSNQIEDVKAYYHDMLETLFPDGTYLDLCDTTAYNSKWKTLSEISTQQSNSIKGE